MDDFIDVDYNNIPRVRLNFEFEALMRHERAVQNESYNDWVFEERVRIENIITENQSLPREQRWDWDGVCTMRRAKPEYVWTHLQ